MTIKDNSNTEKKLRDIHNQIVNKNTKITEPMRLALLNLLKDNTNILTDESDKSNELRQILLECVYELDDNCNYKCMYDSDIFEELIFIINKKCNVSYYNDSINKKLNNDIDYLLKQIQYDKNVLKKITKATATENFVMTLLRCARHQDFLKIFTSIPESSKTFGVCRIAIEKDVNMIKYIENQTEELCMFAIMMGHKKLSDIHRKNHTVNICKKYIDVDIKNLKAIKYTIGLKFPEMFFMEYIKTNPRNIEMIDQLYIDPEIFTYVVKHDGLLLKYIESRFQSIRLIELACKQNSDAKYYIKYDCPSSCDVEWLKIDLDKYISLIKQLTYSNKNHLNKFEMILKQINHVEKNIFSTESGILFAISLENSKFYLMTPENYICHQHQLRIEKGFMTNFEILLDKKSTFFTTNHNNLIKSEYSTFFMDWENEYVMFLEIIE